MDDDDFERFDPGSPPPGIGPHEGRELDLMLKGEKPLTYFSEPMRSSYELPDAEFEPHVKAGRIVKKDFIEDWTIDGRAEQVRFLYYALPNEEWRIDAAIKLTMPSQRHVTDYDEIDRQLGSLLGYTEEEIDVFLEWGRYLEKLRRVDS